MASGKHHGRGKAKARNAHINPMRPRPQLRRDGRQHITVAPGQSSMTCPALPVAAEVTV